MDLCCLARCDREGHAPFHPGLHLPFDYVQFWPLLGSGRERSGCGLRATFGLRATCGRGIACERRAFRDIIGREAASPPPGATPRRAVRKVGERAAIGLRHHASTCTRSHLPGIRRLADTGRRGKPRQWQERGMSTRRSP